ENGIIKCVKPVEGDFEGLILPGFIDAHIHIESSMLTPSRFAEAVVPHGTTSVVSDPHEIANVMGLDGIKYMIDDASSVPLRVFFTAPSCVPATPFETSGATIGPSEIDFLLEDDHVVALGEMMNFPGVIGEDPVVMEKIRRAKIHKKPIDGHAPLLSGDELCKYIATGISTDHECTLKEESLEKRRLGMKIMLREGSSAKNLEDLISAGGNFIVSDDKHPEDLLIGHLDQSLRKAVELGLDPIKAVKMVTLNPETHYNLNTGSIAPGKAADLVVVNNLKNFNVEEVYIGGNLVARDGKVHFTVQPLELKSTFNLNLKKASDFEVLSVNEDETVRVIDVIEGQLLTEESEASLSVVDSKIKPDTEKDILKIAVVERYGHEKVSNAFVHGFKLKDGAIASSVAHDSHNIIVVGTNSKDMAEAVNILVKNKGGLVALTDKGYSILKLPIGGLMSSKNAVEVSTKLKSLHKKVKERGCRLDSPFMTLSFLALLVIPKLKISDKGLFDVEIFQFVDVVKK
ncbi:MAG: adenine deaminase, partial [Euryarchaeota archaeon]|nr:adenine deaminase [Euryarchaeota archaeon]